MRQANEKFREKIKESVASVLPITIIVLLLSFTIAPLPTDTLMGFIIGAVLLIVGMGLFTLGSDMAMMPMGEHVGSSMTKTKKIGLVVFACFLIGAVITISEPDLTVLASQVPSVPDRVLIFSVAAGVGVFLVVAVLRILFSIRLSYLLVGCYLLLFGISAFVPGDFLAVAFDAGGVTTGPMTVPFIMALGVGIAAIRSDKHAQNDSFGLVALCSVGPILAVLILGLVYQPESTVYVQAPLESAANSQELWGLFTHGFPEYFMEVLIALLPIVLLFIVFQLVSLRLPRIEMLKIVVGILYTYLGLVLFLTGVNVGFMPAGNFLGQVIAGLDFNWIIVPIGMLIGYFIVSAEPAVHVLSKQVVEITNGAIPAKALSLSLSIGVCASVGLAMVRVLTGISIYWLLIPGYAIALILSFKVPRIFTAVAFDSGGVASGPMTATFLLPFAIGACNAVGGNVITDAFGIVAMVAMTPLITIQILGLYYQFKIKSTPEEMESEDMDQAVDDDIIELGDGD